MRGVACVAFAQGAGAVSARRAGGGGAGGGGGGGGCRPSALAHARPAAGASERSNPHWWRLDGIRPAAGATGSGRAPQSAGAPLLARNMLPTALDSYLEDH
jgi:hypothetical protein